MRFTINVKVDGKPTAIVFAGKDANRNRRTIEISSSNIQEQMEKSPDFGVYFSLDWEKEIEEATEKEVILYHEHTIEPIIPKKAYVAESLADAKKYLTLTGIRTYPSMNKEKAVEAAKESGIELTIKN